MNSGKALQTSLVLGVFILGSISSVCADQQLPELVQQVTTELPQQSLQLEAILETQDRLDSEARSMQEVIEQDRRMHAMQREAVLRAELNMAWIYDELENWDCRVAEQKTAEVALRLAEQREFGDQLNAMCSVVDGSARNQQQACQIQRERLAVSIANLEKLSSRYASSCLLPITIDTEAP